MRTVEKKQLTPPSRWWSAPNVVSLTRIFLAPVIAWFVWAGHEHLALGLFAVAASTDFLDGFLARTAKATSPLGVYLDPIADKILLVGVYLSLSFNGLVPIWFFCVVFGRDFALVVASALAVKFSSYDNYRPTIWGKISTFWQIVAAVAAMVDFHAGFARWAVYISAIATVWSAIHYTYRGVSFFYRR